MSLHQRIEAIRRLSDEALLHSLKRFVGSQNHLTALVLAHLAEVDARGAYRRWACDTLVTYCVYELRFSEDEAQRRCRASRVAQQFPVLFEMLEDASIHLTGILLLAPYLTEENHRNLLARARYRRKSEILRLVAELAPSCDVPAVIEPLGPERAPCARPRSAWGATHEAVMGGVRQLVPGDGPAEAPAAPYTWREDLLLAIEKEAIEPSSPEQSSTLDPAEPPAPTRSKAIDPRQRGARQSNRPRLPRQRGATDWIRPSPPRQRGARPRLPRQRGARPRLPRQRGATDWIRPRLPRQRGATDWIRPSPPRQRGARRAIRSARAL